MPLFEGGFTPLQGKQYIQNPANKKNRNEVTYALTSALNIGPTVHNTLHHKPSI